MDIFSKSKRSQIMGAISGRETKPEIKVRKFLFSKGFRYRKNVTNLPGKPDIVLPKYKTIIFIHGCFWHCHDCNAAKLPNTNREFWENKISANQIRDQKQQNELKNIGWKVIIVWQCELSSKPVFEKKMKLLIHEIKSNSKNL